MVDTMRGARIYDAVQVIAAAVLAGCIVFVGYQNMFLRGILRSVASARAATVTDSPILHGRWYEPLDPAAGSAPEPAGAASRVLLLVVRHDCAPCQQALEQWRAVLVDPPAARNTFELWIATPDRLPAGVSWSDFAESKVPVRLLRILNPEDFATGVGIRTVPMSIAVAGTSILATVAGPPSPDGLASILSLILDPTLSSPTYLYVERNPGMLALLTLPPTTEDALAGIQAR